MPKDVELFNLPCLVVHKKSKPVLILKILIRSVINYGRYLGTSSYLNDIKLFNFQVTLFVKLAMPDLQRYP